MSIKETIVTRGKPIFGDGGTVLIDRGDGGSSIITDGIPDLANSYRPIEAKTFGV